MTKFVKRPENKKMATGYSIMGKTSVGDRPLDVQESSGRDLDERTGPPRAGQSRVLGDNGGPRYFGDA